MDGSKTEMDKIAGKLHNKYIGVEPMLLIGVIALIIIYYNIFSSLGNNEDGSGSVLKVLVETILWLLFIVLLLLNGVSYIFGIDLIKTLTVLFKSDMDRGDFDESDDEEDNGIKLVLKEQVFHLPENKYNYNDAKAVCNAYGARLATFDEISNAYDKGADWCTYGWSEDQMALFPTQKEKWERLQKKQGHEQDCGHPGLNGGYIYDSSMNYGANCYGPKPSITKQEADAMREKPFFNKNKKELKFEDRVKYWRNKISQITLAPFNHDNWSMV
jgi:hypothetical protein